MAITHRAQPYARAIGALVVSVVLAGTPASAGPKQRVEGEVTVPTASIATWNARVTCDMSSSLTMWALGQAVPCEAVQPYACPVGPDVVQGARRHEFDVARVTIGERFRLTASNPMADLEIFFLDHEGRSVGLSRDIGDEVGTVPPKARRAAVCLSHGLPTMFTYVAG